jgi:hypothetical protein
VSRRTCEEALRWLDAGNPGAPPDWLLEHACDCAPCAAALARSAALDAWLGETIVAPAPAGFDAAVMARLDPPLARPARPPAPAWPDPMPAWVRAAMEPAVMLALVLAALCVWQGDRLAGLAFAAGRALGGGLMRPALPAPAWAVALAFLPPSLVASAALYRWSGRLVMRNAGFRLWAP